MGKLTASPTNLDCFVLEVAFAFQGFCVFVFAQNIFVELHFGAAEILEERFDAFLALYHFVGEIVYIDIDADRAHDAEFLVINRDGRAFEFSRSDIQLIVQLVFVLELALL